MKNRLQIRYHIPETLPTRGEAMSYLKEYFGIGYGNNPSLIAEPLVMLYNDVELDVSNGITETERLKTSNAILAIGRGGDGSDVLKNEGYFVIDFAKHSEEIAKNIEDIAKHNENLIRNNEDIEKHSNDIAELMSHKEDVLNVVDYVNKTIEDFKQNIQNNSEEITSLLSKIGNKSDSDKADTVYGYVNLLEKNIDIERERAEDAESKLSNDIVNETIRSTSEEKRIEDKLDVEISRAKDKEESLKTDLDKTNENLSDEVKRSISEEKRIEDKLDAEINRAKTSEHEEYDRAFKAEGDLNKRIDDLSTVTDSEISRAKAAEKTLTDDLTAEIQRARNNEDRIEGVLNSEISRSTTKDSEIDAKIIDTNNRLSDEISRSTTKENDLQKQITDEQNFRISADTELSKAISANNTLIVDETSNRKNADDAIRTEFSNADTAIDTKFSGEVSRLENKIENLISTEKNTFEKALHEVNTDLNNKISNGENSIKRLEEYIESNRNKITENKVHSDSKTITINSTPETGTNIDVNIDNNTIVKNESGTLSVSSSALVQYKGENSILVSDVVGSVKTVSLNINPNDNILINDENGLLSALTLKWVKSNSENQKDEIQLIGKNNKIISSIDVADFIKDGMLDSVRLDSSNSDSPVLIFTFNSASGKETLNVNVKDLVDVYTAGNGINKIENVFSVLIDPSSEGFINVSEYGVKLHGIQNAINNSKNEVLAALELDRSNNTSIQNQLSTSLTGEISERKEKNAEIISAYKKADADIITAYKEADNAIITGYTTSDTILRNELIARCEKIESDLISKDDLVKQQISASTSTITSKYLAADAELSNSLKTTSEKLDSFITGNTILSDSTHYTDDKLSKAERDLSGLIDTESIRAISAETELSRIISAEVNRSSTEEKRIEDKLDAEISRSTEKENSLKDDLDKTNENLSNTNDKLDAEISRSKNTEEELTKAIDTERIRAISAETELSAIISVEVNRSSTEEKRIEDKLDAEINRATSVEGNLNNLIGVEQQRAEAVEATLNTLISDEQQRATSAETILTTLINGETVRATSVETELSNKIDIINSNVTENGSIKSVIYNSFTNDDPLIRKTIDTNGNISIYSSNKTEDMLHGNDVLSGVIEGIKKDIDLLTGKDNDLDTNITGIYTQISTNTANISKLSDDLNGEINTINGRIDTIDSNVNTLESKVDDLEDSIESTVTTQITPLQETIGSLKSIISGLTEELNTLREELNELKSKAFTSIIGTDNEIDVVISGNTATIKFADDAYFVAGDSNEVKED